MRQLKKMDRKGFTIVELLIVIVIIGILATIGFVSFSNAQNKAKKSKAEATVSQVKSKLGEYFAENNNYPADKAAVVTYLQGNGGAETSEEFNKADYGYTAGPSGCTTNCNTYELRAEDSYWNKNDDSEDISVQP